MGVYDDDDDRIHMSLAEVLEQRKKARERGSRGSVDAPRSQYCESLSCRYVMSHI